MVVFLTNTSKHLTIFCLSARQNNRVKCINSFPFAFLITNKILYYFLFSTNGASLCSLMDSKVAERFCYYYNFEISCNVGRMIGIIIKSYNFVKI